MKRFSLLCAVLTFALTPLLTASVVAADTNGAFSLQVSPSPVVETVKPGQTSTVEVHIRNTGSLQEKLKIGLRAFSVDNATGTVKLNSEEPKDVSGWVSFSDPTFTVVSGASFTEHVQLAVPANAGFSYSFALLISRENPRTTTPGKTAIEGSVAIFTLLSVDRPDATRKIEVLSFSSKKKVYEFLPSEFSLQIKNSGNTIIQPAGNVFVQRDANSATPLAVLPVNATGAYILPGVSRTVSSNWTDGFPVYKTDSGSSDKHLVWDWGTLQKLRIGHFTAKAIVIYNDGVRDIPVEATVGFWVIPWRLLGVFLVVLLLVIIGVATLVRKTARMASKKDGQDKDS